MSISQHLLVNIDLKSFVLFISFDLCNRSNRIRPWGVNKALGIISLGFNFNMSEVKILLRKSMLVGPEYLRRSSIF